MTNRWFAKLFIIFTLTLGVVGCQMAEPDGPSLELLETNGQGTEVEPTPGALTVGDLLSTVEESPDIAVQQTVTAQAQKISAILATLESPTPVPTAVPASSTPVPPTQVPPTQEPPTLEPTVVPEPLAESSEALISGPAPLFAEALLAHNEVRAETGLPPLVWDPEYAQASQRWADVLAAQGFLQHDPNANTWENVSQQVAGTTPREIVQSPVFGWASDREREVFAATNGCPFDHEQFMICGHYRVITNPELTSVGCGVTNSDIWDFWVCRFR